MFHIIQSVDALPDFKLRVHFVGGITTLYNMVPLIARISAFAKLKDNPQEFLSVKVDVGRYGIVWSDELDLSSDELWENSIIENAQV